MPESLSSLLVVGDFAVWNFIAPVTFETMEAMPDVASKLLEVGGEKEIYPCIYLLELFGFCPISVFYLLKI